MIVAVEGPSASGKTTWLRQFMPAVVPEAEVTDDAPNRNVEPEAAEHYWAEKNSERWAAAVQLESSGETVFCDTDPLKLHYVWSLWQIGAASRRSWDLAVEIHRDLVSRKEMGFADVVFVHISDLATLRAQKESDSTRTRRNFELHETLSEPLRAWYATLAKLSPGRVIWSFPDRRSVFDQISLVGPRASRYSLELFSSLVNELDVPDLRVNG